jgi:hypothetical protein
MNPYAALTSPATLASSQRAIASVVEMARLQREIDAYRTVGRHDLADEHEVSVVRILGTLTPLDAGFLVRVLVRSFPARLQVCDGCRQRLTDGALCDVCQPATAPIMREIADAVVLDGRAAEQ